MQIFLLQDSCFALRDWLLEFVNLSFTSMRDPHEAVCPVTLHQQQTDIHVVLGKRKTTQFLHTTESAQNQESTLTCKKIEDLI